MIKLEEAIKKYINDLPFGNAFDDCDIKKAIEFGAQWQQANGWIRCIDINAPELEKKVLVDGREYLVYGCIDSFTKCIAHVVFKDGWFVYKYDGRFVCNVEAVMTIPELP